MCICVYLWLFVTPGTIRLPIAVFPILRCGLLLGPTLAGILGFVRSVRLASRPPRKPIARTSVVHPSGGGVFS